MNLLNFMIKKDQYKKIKVFSKTWFKKYCLKLFQVSLNVVYNTVSLEIKLVDVESYDFF